MLNENQVSKAAWHKDDSLINEPLGTENSAGDHLAEETQRNTESAVEFASKVDLGRISFVFFRVRRVDRCLAEKERSTRITRTKHKQNSADSSEI